MTRDLRNGLSAMLTDSRHAHGGDTLCATPTEGRRNTMPRTAIEVLDTLPQFSTRRGRTTGPLPNYVKAAETALDNPDQPVKVVEFLADDGTTKADIKAEANAQTRQLRRWLDDQRRERGLRRVPKQADIRCGRRMAPGDNEVMAFTYVEYFPEGNPLDRKSR